jgi:hypothetical protein
MDDFETCALLSVQKFNVAGPSIGALAIQCDRESTDKDVHMLADVKRLETRNESKTKVIILKLKI